MSEINTTEYVFVALKRVEAYEDCHEDILIEDAGINWPDYACANEYVRELQARVETAEAENRRLRRRCALAIWEGASVIADFAKCSPNTAVRDLAKIIQEKGASDG